MSHLSRPAACPADHALRPLLLLVSFSSHLSWFPVFGVLRGAHCMSPPLSAASSHLRPCLLRCLAFSPSGVNSKCPLCFYVFTSSDLLPVDLRPRHRPAVGQPFSFQRVHRIEGTCLVVPYKDWR